MHGDAADGGVDMFSLETASLTLVLLTLGPSLASGEDGASLFETSAEEESSDEATSSMAEQKVVADSSDEADPDAATRDDKADDRKIEIEIEINIGAKDRDDDD
jgi:hypothetical protein